MFPQVGGLATLPDKTLLSGEPIGGPDGPRARCVRIPRTGKSCYRQKQTVKLLQTASIREKGTA